MYQVFLYLLRINNICIYNISTCKSSIQSIIFKIWNTTLENLFGGVLCFKFTMFTIICKISTRLPDRPRSHKRARDEGFVTLLSSLQEIFGDMKLLNWFEEFIWLTTSWKVRSFVAHGQYYDCQSALTPVWYKRDISWNSHKRRICSTRSDIAMAAVHDWIWTHGAFSYWPDLASPDVYLLPILKKELSGKYNENENGVISAVEDFLNNHEEAYSSAIQTQQQRW